jgi:small conductance mechanosensitive channel
MHNYLLKSWQTVQGMMEKFFVLLPELILGIVVFAVFWFIGLAAQWVVEHLSHKYRQARNLGLVLGRLSHAMVIIVGLLVALTIVAPTFQMGDLIKVLGIGGIAIGFAFREILQNFLAGILLLLHEPFRIGDEIKIDEFEGTVEAIQTRATTIKTYDSRRIVIPNTDLFTKPVIVNTAYASRRAEYVVGVGFGDDIERAKELISEAVRGIEGVLADPPPQVLTTDLADFSVQITALYWTKPPEHMNLLRVQNAVISAIKSKLSDAGIDLPFPTHQILLHDQTEETDGDRSRQREGWPAGQEYIPKPRNISSVMQESLDAKQRAEAHGSDKQAA